MHYWLYVAYTKVRVPCFGQFSQIFKTKFLVQTLVSQPNVSAKLRALWIKICSKFANCESKTIPILEIEDLAFMLRSIKQRAFFDSLSSQSNKGKSNILLP